MLPISCTKGLLFLVKHSSFYAAFLVIDSCVLTPQITGQNLKDNLGLIKFGNHDCKFRIQIAPHSG